MANQIVVSAGAKVRNLQDVIIGTSGVLTSLGFDVANGVPRLDVNGKILVSQLPNSVMEYKGTWNVSTNTPTLVNGTGNQGDVYLVEGAAVGGTAFNFGAGPITFFNGDQAIYSGSIWQRASGATGTVTSVAVTESGDSLNITGSPITTSGTINIGFNGTNLQYVNGAGNLTTFPTLITSIGLSMPSAFSVANSPLTANGTIAVTGAGVASQYIRGDGTLADFPSSGGGGSSVSYYLNGGTSQGTIGGTTYYEMSKTAVIGTGVDFAKSGDGFIVAFLTDANDPAQLNIPAGNWNYEIYASMSSNGGTPQMYAELYVYDGTTFTLISTSSNEIIYDGTALNLYTFAMAVPATTLALTDRLAIKLYATNSGGKTTTVHTQDSHLCQVITTFSTGITALNGLTAQVQYFQTGTSGTDFNISSTTATHTFNIPDASATARGLITTGTQTIAGTKTFNDATKNNGGIFLQNGSSNALAGYMNLGGLTNGVKFTSGGGVSNTFTLPSATGYTFTFPNATGTIALTSDIPSLSGTAPISYSAGVISISQSTTSTNGYLSSTDWNTFNLKQPQLNGTGFVKASGTTISYDNSTYALDSAVVHLAGTETITGAKTFSTFTKFDGGVILKNNVSASLAGYVGLSAYSASGNKGINIDFDTYSNSFYFSGTLPYQYTFPAATGTIALVGGSGVGTVTSVAALTIGTSGTDLSSSVANSTTTPVITLNVPTASAANRGALSSADWTTFNNKQSALTIGNLGSNDTNFLSVTGGAGSVIGSGVTLYVYPYNIVSSGLTLTTTGSSGAATKVTNTLNIPTYTLSGLGGIGGSGDSGYLPKFTSASTIGNSQIFDNGTNVGINQPSPTRTLDILGASGVGTVLKLQGASGTTTYLQLAYNGATNAQSGYIGYNSSSQMQFFTNDTLRATLDASGNLGLGVTPSAWYSGWKAIEGAASLAIASKGLGMYVAQNSYLNAATDWIYSTTAAATYYQQYSGAHYWTTAPSGTAGNAITFTQAMTLTAAGRLLINKNNEETYQLDVNGTGRFVGSVTAASAIFNNATNSTDGIKIIASLTSSAFTSGIELYRTGVSGGAKIEPIRDISIGGVGLKFLVTANNTAEINATYTSALAILNNGNVGIGTNSPTYFFDVLSSSVSTARFKDSARFCLLTLESSGTNQSSYLEFKPTGTGTAIIQFSGSTALTIASGNAATFSSSVTATSFFESSDSRLKTLIQDNYQTKGIASITPKLYTKNGKVELGYYAQDFVGVLDSAVSKGSDDMLSLSYREVLVAKVYALEQRIKELENK
jgi:hypothetical protein